MPTFAYVAKDKAGKIHRGRAEADNEKMLQKRLSESGYWVTQVTREGANKKKKKPISTRWQGQTQPPVHLLPPVRHDD